MLRRIAVTAAIALAASPAFAHTGHDGPAGFAHGFVHPIGGLDHVLAMLAVGIWAAQLGGSARWALPGTFVSVMGLGALLGTAGVPLPGAEAGIVASIMGLGAAIALGAGRPLAMRAAPALAAAAVALFAVVHGFAHGAEMPSTVGGLAYGIGFAVASILLHAGGFAMATLLRRTHALRPLGGLIAAAGLVLGTV
jgi:urease accessory protein